MNRELLLDRLRAVAETCTDLLAACPRHRLDFRPGPGVRSLHELADHFAAVPLVDLAVLQGNPKQVAGAIEDALHGAGPDDWVDVFARGVRAVRDYFAGLTEEEFESRSTRAHYGTARPQCVWLVELIGHLFHHRGQLYAWLRLAGVPVGPPDLYT